MIDEGPSQEDIERFNRHDSFAFCPSCGAEMSDLADVCPKCFEFLPDGPIRQSPIDRHFEQKWIIIVVALVVLALVGLFSL